jgi:hypothetical protein
VSGRIDTASLFSQRMAATLLEELLVAGQYRVRRCALSKLPVAVDVIRALKKVKNPRDAWIRLKMKRPDLRNETYTRKIPWRGAKGGIDVLTRDGLETLVLELKCIETDAIRVVAVQGLRAMFDQQ